MLRQGPHHGAQKSTSTGSSPCADMALEAGAIERQWLAGEQGLVAAPAGRRGAEAIARHAVERGTAGAGHEHGVVGGSVHARIPAGDGRGTAQASPRRANRA
jgi:hypothetical protein